MQTDDELTAVVRSRQMHIYRNGKKILVLAGKVPTHVFAGMHLVKSGLSLTEEDSFIAELASELMKYKECMFYTMHCTGEEQYKKLKSIMGRQIEYMACGDKIMI